MSTGSGAAVPESVLGLPLRSGEVYGCSRCRRAASGCMRCNPGKAEKHQIRIMLVAGSSQPAGTSDAATHAARVTNKQMNKQTIKQPNTLTKQSGQLTLAVFLALQGCLWHLLEGCLMQFLWLMVCCLFHLLEGCLMQFMRDGSGLLLGCVVGGYKCFVGFTALLVCLLTC